MWVGPDVGVKSSPNLSKVEVKVASINPKKSPNNWATFERKFVIKNIQKSPNLVTLITDREGK